MSFPAHPIRFRSVFLSILLSVLLLGVGLLLLRPAPSVAVQEQPAVLDFGGAILSIQTTFLTVMSMVKRATVA